MKIRRLDHISFAVEDVTEVAGRFRDVLGLKVRDDIDHNGTRKVLMNVGDVDVELLGSAQHDTRTGAFLATNGPGFFHLCFEVEDIDATLRELRDNGIALSDPAPIPTFDGGRAIFAELVRGMTLEFKQRQEPKR